MPTTIIPGNIAEVLDSTEANWFHAIMTSPPYWMLRQYGTPPQHWPAMRYRPMTGLRKTTLPEWEGELGQEPTVEMFIGHLLYCCRKLRRVLRDDGTLWINLGDSYAGNGKSMKCDKTKSTLEGSHHSDRMRSRGAKRGIKAKNRIGVPWRFALAMQADGWIWRDEVIWHKPSTMPGSQRDRTTTAHEIVLMFSKRGSYFYDIHAIHEQSVDPSDNRKARAKQEHKSLPEGERGGVRAGSAIYPTRNPRSVWRLSSEPSKEKHFACWPTKLVKKMILASTSEHGCCAACGAPWRKKLARERVATRPGNDTKLNGVALDPSSPYQAHSDITGNRDPQRHTTVLTATGWEPTCDCTDCGISPCRVLDPFGGMGTTALVAERLHRDCTIIELNQAYATRAEERLAEFREKEAGMFA